MQNIQNALGYSWEKIPLPPQLKQKLAEEIDQKLADSPSLAVHETQLPFYPNHRLLFLFDPEYKVKEIVGDPTAPSFLAILLLGAKDDGEYFMLDGSHETLKKIHDALHFTLLRKDFLEYIKFYFASIVSDHGGFVIVSDPGHIPFTAPPSASLQAELAALITPPTVIKESARAFTAEACIFFNDTLYRATFQIARTGEIEITEDKPLKEHLAARLPTLA